MIEKQLRAWKEAEQAAQQAEEAIRRSGQCAEGPLAAAVCQEARVLRETADALFKEVQAALPPGRP